MTKRYKLCIVKPNQSVFSETFIQEHINRLSGDIKVIYGGAFPLYDHHGKFLIQQKISLLIYLFQKRILRRKDIKVRTTALSNYLKKESIDVVLAEYGMTGGVITDACKIAGVPLVIHFHGADAHHKQTVADYKEFYRKSFKYTSGIVAVSRDMINTLISLGAPEEKLAYIPCGVNTSLFQPIQIHPFTRNFLFIGRFVEKKSPLSVVKAFETVLIKMPDAKLWMVGKGPLYKKVNDYLLERNLTKSIFLTGVLSQDEIKLLIPKMRCYVQHSVTAIDGDMEGSPVAIIEAGASGLPIVSTRHAGIKEAVLDGKTGFLVDEHDISGMAEKMLLLASDFELAVNMGKAGRKHVIENYAIEKQINKLDQLIQQAMLK